MARTVRTVSTDALPHKTGQGKKIKRIRAKRNRLAVKRELQAQR